MRIGGTVRCDGCSRDIDPSGPGVTESANAEPWWQPSSRTCARTLRSTGIHAASPMPSGSMPSSTRCTVRTRAAGSARTARSALPCGLVPLSRTRRDYRVRCLGRSVAATVDAMS